MSTRSLSLRRGLTQLDYSAQVVEGGDIHFGHMCWDFAKGLKGRSAVLILQSQGNLVRALVSLVPIHNKRGATIRLGGGVLVHCGDLLPFSIQQMQRG